MSENKFHNKVAIVTGSGMGIGKAIALQLAEAGASIVLNDINSGRLKKSESDFKVKGFNVLAVLADLNLVDDCKNLIDKTIEAFGRIDILVNNAGISMRGDFETIKPEVFTTVFNVNVFGKLYPSQFAIPFLKKSKGSVVFISSAAGIRGLPSLSAYSASKMALTAFAESIKLELAQEGVHVGIVYVGITKNDVGKTFLNSDGTYHPINNRDSRKVLSQEYVAKSVLKLIRRRKFRLTLSFMGKLNRVMNILSPRLVDRLLILSKKKIEKLNK